MFSNPGTGYHNDGKTCEAHYPDVQPLNMNSEPALEVSDIGHLWRLGFKSRRRGTWKQARKEKYEIMSGDLGKIYFENDFEMTIETFVESENKIFIQMDLHHLKKGKRMKIVKMIR